MPTMWFVPDGRTAYTEGGPGVPLSFEEAAVVFGTEDMRYLGPRPASIGVDREPGDVPNVVVEVVEGEGSNVLLPSAGYYWALSIDPDTARQRLDHERRH